MKRLTDPTFEYHNSADTDLRRTFARVRRELAEAKARQEAEARMATAPAAEVIAWNGKRKAAP